MNPILIASLRTLLADPDRPDRNALFAVLDDTQAARVLACLAPTRSLAQIAAALRSEWSWDCDGWDRHIDELMGLITDSRCPSPSIMISTWNRIPNAVGVLRDRTDTLIAWVKQRLTPWINADFAILLGPSDESARLLVQSPSPYAIGRTLRRWGMVTDPDDPTMWQTLIDPDMRAALHQNVNPSDAFPAWGWDDAVNPDDVLTGIVNDLIAGWSPDHPSLRGRIAWLEHHVDTNLDIDHLALVASIGRSDVLAEAVCAHLGHDPSSIPRIAEVVPWSRLHPRIQTVIDTTMRRSPDNRWKRTWVCALGRFPIMPDNDIDAFLLLWRIDRARWASLDAALRAALFFHITHHCFGWGIHPDLVVGKYCPDGQIFRFWNPDVPPDDLRAWVYADGLSDQRTLQAAQDLIALLDTLPPDRRTQFEQFIDVRLGGYPEAQAQPPWDWAGWTALPAAERQQRLCDRLRVLWRSYNRDPAVPLWRVRNDGLTTLALMVGEVLGLDDPSPILAALLAQIPAIRGDATDVGSSLPFPDDLDAARRAQITRLPLARDAQAYAAWCLRVLDQDMGLGSTLIALHPTVAVALAPLLNTDQQKAVAASPATQGWNSMTVLHWTAVCENKEESIVPPIQRRIS